MSEASTVTTARKKKLRTAAEVVSRLRWCPSDVDAATETVRIGYDDRIHGPLEKYLEDYVPIEEGGDLPEHRIHYFRRVQIGQEQSSADVDASTILWDRLGRVDRLFGSGNGKAAHVPAETLQQIQQAILNAKEIEAEKELRRAEKAKRKARERRRKQQALLATVNSRQNDESAEKSAPVATERHTWERLDECAAFARDMLNPSTHCKSTHKTVKIVTWNVLFDLYENTGLDCQNDKSVARWKILIDLLAISDPDIVALQEVTPRFASLLLEHACFQHGYASSVSSPTDLATITPFGNLLMWKRDTFQLLALSAKNQEPLSFVCNDGARNRSILVGLQSKQDPTRILLCANVHLPADNTNHADPEQPSACRKLARKRELVAVIGKLQLLEQQLLARCGKQKHQYNVMSILVGDFNTHDQAELEDGYFSGRGRDGAFFVDAWDSMKDEGYTFNPFTNVRASRSKKGPRRIDRVYFGNCTRESNAFASLVLHNVKGKLLGTTISNDVPPSDHYGLCVSFEFGVCKEGVKMPFNEMASNAWAANCPSSSNTLLALVLDEPTLGETKILDPSSTLPIPHITLLHGFAELSSDESRLLATQTVANAVKRTLPAPSPSGSNWYLPFNASSLSAFEHRASSTLVCLPDVESEQGLWLRRLYQTLRESFCQCHEQESRFHHGWMPHCTYDK